MKNFIQRGDVLTVVAAAAVTSGGVVIAGELAGVAVTSAAQGQEVEVSLAGVYELPKASGGINQGVKVYWNATDGNIVTTASGNTLIGYAWKAAVSAATTVEVKLLW